MNSLPDFAETAYCANCGQPTSTTNLCLKCFSDPLVPIEFYGHSTPAAGDCIDSLLRRPGEAAALALPLGIVGLGLVVVSLVTAGVLALALTASLLALRVRQKRLKLDYTEVGPALRPEVQRLSALAASRLEMQPVDVVVRQKLEPNAACAGFLDDHWVVIDSGLFNYVEEPTELLFVIGHELGHIRRQHTTWLLLSATAAGNGIPFLSPFLRLLLNRWHLSAEYGADRAGYLACRDLNAAVNALARLQFWDEKVDIETILQDDAAELEDPMTRLAETFGSHPYFVNRVRRLVEFARGLKEVI